MAKQYLKKAFLVLFLVLLCEKVFSTLVRKSMNQINQDCSKKFQDKCVKECNDLKRILCFCKEYKVLDQINHKCLCAADKTECEKELQSFIQKF
jgi:hypothetical protein